MNTRKSHKSRQVQTRTALPKPGANVQPAVSADVGASSSTDPATTRTLLPAILEKSTDTAVVSDMADKKGGPTEGDQPVVVLPPKGAEVPIWWRRPDSKLRKTAEKIVVMRVAGRGDAEIAKKLKTTEQNVRQTMYLARKNGWLTEDETDVVDIEAQLAMEVDRQVVRNIAASLDGGMTNWQTHEMTIAAAKGRGIFKNHEKTEGGAAVLAPVAIQIIMPSIGAENQTIVEENVGGLPAYVEGEVEDGLDGNGHLALQAGEPAEED